MAVNPVNVNRVTSTLQSSSLLRSLRRNTLDVFLEQNRLSIGRQFLSPSDDPRRAAQALNLNEILDKQSQLLTNIRHASNTLDATDVAMAEVSDLIIEAQAVASQNLGSLAGPDEREAAAEVVASIREQLVTVGNREFDGRSLFGGRHTDRSPFISALGGVAYRGDTGDVLARTEFDELEPINLAGNELFGALSDPIPQYVDLDPIISEGTRVEDLSGAINQGINLGTFQIVEGGGVGAVSIELTGADTAGDIVDRINAAAEEAGAGFTASLGEFGINIAPGGSNVVIRDISTGTTARDLGLVTPQPTGAQIVGPDLGVALSRTTRIEDLQAGAGVDLSTGIIVSNGPVRAEIDLFEAQSVQDILNAINSAGAFVRAQINESRTGIEVINTVSGTAMSVGENGGAIATTLGIRTMHAGTRLADLNSDQGVRTVDGKTDLTITAKNGDQFEVNLDGAVTIDDVLLAINEAATAAGVSVTADLAGVGNGIRLTDGTGGAGRLSVGRANLSFAVDDLGINTSVDGMETELIGQDAAAVKVGGILSAMFDLERALLNNDSQAMSIASEDIDAQLVDFNRARGLVGARAAAMQDRLTQTDNAVFATESFLSEVQDLDFTEAVTRFQQAQTSLQATLLTGTQLLNTSLLNFLQ